MKRIEDTKGGLLKDCYRWILNHHAFIDWRDGDTVQLLWIKGDPGKGKTMLMIGIVRELTPTHDSDLLSYFFCQATDSSLNKATAVLRGLIYQLVVQQRFLISHLRERYDKERQLFEGINAFYALQDIFTKMLHDSRLKRVYLIVDALDECEEGLSQLLELIVRNVFTSSSRVKWLVSSRYRPEIEVGLRINESKVECSLELNEKSVSEAVGAYIDYKVSELARTKQYQSNLRDQVRDQLHQKAKGTFLWVALVCKELEKVENWDVPQLLQGIPSDLRPLYARMIKQIQQLEGQSPKFCMEILSILVLAYRPFNLLELATVLPKDIPRVQENLIKIIRLCGSFLTIRDDTIYFIHQSAKDYLCSTSVDHLIFPSGRTEVHRVILSRSLQNMTEKLHKDMYNLQEPGISIDQVTSVHPDPLAQIRYACLHWIYHLSEIDSSFHYQVGLRDNGIIDTFLKKHFLHWLETLSLMRSMSMGVVMIRKLEDLLAQNLNTAMDFLSIIRDANRFILYNRFIIEASPLQVYASALVFSPTMSRIRILFQDESPQWISRSPVVDDNWSLCLQSLEGHTKSVNTVAFSQDGRRLASGSDDRTVRIWDAETGALQRTLQGHTDCGQVSGLLSRRAAASVWFRRQNGADLGRRNGSATADAARSYRLGQVSGLLSRRAAASVWFRRQHGADLGRRDGSATADAARSYRLGQVSGLLSRRAAASVWFADSTVRIWDAETGAPQRTLQGHTDSVWSVAFSHDGRRLASGSDDRTVRIWDAETGALQRTLEGHTDSVRSVAFSHDGRRLASGSDDRTVRIWDAETGALQQTLEGHTDWVRSVAFSHDGRRLASGSDDSTVRIWDAETGALQRTLEGHTNSVSSVAFSHDGRRLASGSDDRTVRIWDAETGALQRTLEGHTDSVRSVAFSHDGRRLASGSDDSTVRIWDAETGALQRTLEGHTDWVMSVAFSHDGRRLASGSDDSTVRIWDAETGALQRTLEGHTDWVRSVAFSHDGRRLASGSDDSTVRIWDAETGALQRTLEGHTNSVRSVAFSHDGRRLASGSYDSTVRIWDAETGALQRTLEIGAPLSALSFSSDDCNLITQLGCIALDQPSLLLPIGTPNWSGYCLHANGSWITRNGKKVLWLPPEYRPVTSIVRKRTVAIGCASGQVLLISMT